MIAGEFTTETSGILTAGTNYSYEAREMVMMVYAKKDTRVGYKKFTVELTRGDPPSVGIL